MSLSEDLFARFKKLLAANGGATQELITLCKEKYGLTLVAEELEVKDSIVRVKSTSAVKNKLFMLRADILRELKERGSPIREIFF